MKRTENKTGVNTTGNSSFNLTGNMKENCNKIKIAVLGQHEVGKSALTVRYLTRRFIGEYKSSSDMLYRQKLTVSHGATLEIEIVDISTSEDALKQKRKLSQDETFPPGADAYILVYSITDRRSYDLAIDLLRTISSADSQFIPSSSSSSYDESNCSSRGSSPPSNSGSPISTPMNTSPYGKPACPIVLIGNKNDLEHIRSVQKMEGISAALEFGAQFYELSVAENSPEVFSAFQCIISSWYLSQPSNLQIPKRKFSVSKILGNLRLGKSSNQYQQPTVTSSQASIVDMEANEPFKSLKGYASGSCGNIPSSSNSHNSSLSNHPVKSSTLGKHQRTASDSLTSGLCNLKSKLVEFHSLKKRLNSPPICSL